MILKVSAALNMSVYFFEGPTSYRNDNVIRETNDLDSSGYSSRLNTSLYTIFYNDGPNMELCSMSVVTMIDL